MEQRQLQQPAPVLEQQKFLFNMKTLKHWLRNMLGINQDWTRIQADLRAIMDKEFIRDRQYPLDDEEAVGVFDCYICNNHFTDRHYGKGFTDGTIVCERCVERAE